MSRELILSISKKDFRVDHFRAGGKGGQAQNKKSTGRRVTHIASGAVGEARDSRSAEQNKKAAFRRCIDSDKFQLWFKMEKARRFGALVDVEAQVEKDMHPRNLKIEVRGEDGKWHEMVDRPASVK